MFRFIAFFFLQLSFLTAFAQKNGKSLLVTYDGYQYPGGNEFKVHDIRTTLLISGQQSVSFDSSLPVNRPLGDTGNIYASFKKVRVTYKDRSQKRLVFIGSNYLLPDERRNQYPISDTLFGFDWYITSQTKYFAPLGDVLVKKALAIWRGRAYIAWFTEDLPISEGPWKFGGLPGLIVEIYDEEKNLYWKLSGLQNVAYTGINLPEPQKSYAEVVAAFKKTVAERLAALRASVKEVNPNCSECTPPSFSFPNIENWASDEGFH